MNAPVLTSFFDAEHGRTFYRVSWTTPTGGHTQTFGTLSEANWKLKSLQQVKR